MSGKWWEEPWAKDAFGAFVTSDAHGFMITADENGFIFSIAPLTLKAAHYWREVQPFIGGHSIKEIAERFAKDGYFCRFLILWQTTFPASNLAELLNLRAETNG